MDAVGSTSEVNPLYKEGTGYPALVPFSIDYAFHRDACGKGGSITTFGACPLPGRPVDTDNNAADFVFVDTNGTSAGAGQRLGAPGPENLSSPLNVGTSITSAVLDTCVGPTLPPNFVRDFTSDPANNSTFGTLDLRFSFTNNTGGNLTRLRFRLVDLTTFPAPSGIADLRPRTSTTVIVTVDRPPCGIGTSNVTVNGTTLEQPPSQPNGGGFNSTLSVGTITLATPLANGASVDVRFLLGIQQTGDFRFGIVPEALPGGGLDTGMILVECSTEANCTVAPAVSSIERASPNPTSAVSVDYTVTFNQSVTGVDASDFVLTSSGLSGAAVTNVAGSGATYTVTVDTGSGDGTLRLDIADDDSIVNIYSLPLGGSGADNGDFASGEAYTVDKSGPPSATITLAGGQSPLTPTSPINFTVTFSEAVTGFDESDVIIGGTAGATTAVVTGGPEVYNVAVSGMTGPGTVTIAVGAGAAADAAANASLAATVAAGTEVTFAVEASGAVAVPATSGPILALLAAAMALFGWAARRRV